MKTFLTSRRPKRGNWKWPRRYARGEVDDHKILAQIQHRGGKTNLIDFTADLNIALFLRATIRKTRTGESYFCIININRRAIIALNVPFNPPTWRTLRKSLLCLPPRGATLETKHITIYEIPRELKAGILQHLLYVYGIEPSTVYNDISGFIRDQNQDRFPDFEADFLCSTKNPMLQAIGTKRSVSIPSALKILMVGWKKRNF